MNDFKGLFNIRDYKETDKNFILSTFLKGLYYGNKFYGMIDKTIYMDNYKHVANAIITSPKIVIKVACLPDDPDIILGYSILTNDYQSIIWTFVKTPWRGKGIGKSLVPAYPISYMHFSDVGLELIKRYPNCIFNPFIKF